LPHRFDIKEVAMVAIVEIRDGNLFWLSPSIVPSKDLVVTTMKPPSFAAPTLNSADIFVYVNVYNPDVSVDLGDCTCTQAGKWAEAVVFAGAEASANAHTVPGPGGSSIKLDGVNGDKLLLGPLSVDLNTVPAPPPSPAPQRAWDFSPDGRFLAYVVSINLTAPGAPSAWLLSIFALQPFARADGTMVAPGDAIVSKQQMSTWAWTRTFFRWVGSSAVLAGGPTDPASPPKSANYQMEWDLLCPSAPAASNVWSAISPAPSGSGGALDQWLYLVSPCESVIAFAPDLSAQFTCEFVLVSLSTAQQIPFRSNNVPTPVIARSTHPTIRTDHHTANGVTIDPGDNNMAHFVFVDDPDCTAVTPTTVQVVVDRVKASTLPSANLGVVAVGQASAGPLKVGDSQWVQVPNVMGWANQGEPHWCLLAQAFTQDGTTIPRPWNGQATSPPPFPIQDPNCAQRSIMISLRSPTTTVRRAP
jgi:hypothetical protein